MHKNQVCTCDHKKEFFSFYIINFKAWGMERAHSIGLVLRIGWINIWAAWGGYLLARPGVMHHMCVQFKFQIRRNAIEVFFSSLI